MFAKRGRRGRAPTAGLHLSRALLERVAAAGRQPASRYPACRRRHVPAGQGGRHRRHRMYGDGGGRRGDRPRRSTRAAKAAGGSSRSARLPRAIESAAGRGTAVRPFAGDTAIFMTPGYRFRAVDVADDQLSSAALDAVDAGQRVLRAGDDPPRLRPRDRVGLSLLLLRRRLLCWRRRLDGPAWPAEVFSFHRSRRATAPPALGALDDPARHIRTPAFMPVGTQASVKACRRTRCGTRRGIMLNNAYHLFLRPASSVSQAGRAASFHAMAAPILTDSGGYQYEPRPAAQAHRGGVGVQVAYRRLRHYMTPGKRVEVQHRSAPIS